MKTKIVAAFAALLVSVSAFSQMRPAFGIRAGVNFQNINGKDASDDQLDNNLKVGFHVGVTGDVPIAPDFYVQPGILYSTKGAKIDDITPGNLKLNVGYIEVPINLLYKPLLGEGHLLMGFGPYVAFGINGKVKGDNVDEKIEFGSEMDATNDDVFVLKRFDAGANILFGYEFTQRLSAQLNAQLGLVNIAPDIAGFGEAGKWKNTGFGVSLGYKF